MTAWVLCIAVGLMVFGASFAAGVFTVRLWGEIARDPFPGDAWRLDR